jgi:hypothetical protein
MVITRCTTIIGLCLSLVCVACGKQEGEDYGDVDGAEESTGTGGGVAECGDRATQSDCEAPGGEGWNCAWVDVWSYTTPTCEAGPMAPRCVTLTYQGSGCQVAYACGADSGPNVYVRNAGEAGLELFELETCEYQPDPEWTQCSWDNMEVYPYEACACSC